MNNNSQLQLFIFSDTWYLRVIDLLVRTLFICILIPIILFMIVFAIVFVLPMSLVGMIFNSIFRPQI